MCRPIMLRSCRESGTIPSSGEVNEPLQVKPGSCKGLLSDFERFRIIVADDCGCTSGRKAKMVASFGTVRKRGGVMGNQPWIYTVSVVLLLYGMTSMPARGASSLVVGDFSAAAGEKLPPGWEPLTFEKIEQHTRYDLVRDQGHQVIRARSDGGSSGLIRRITIDPHQYPIISWRWKAMNVLEKGDVTRKSGDDYPARIYISFAYDGKGLGFFERAKYNAARWVYGEYPPLGAVNYIWESRAPEGTTLANAYTDRVMMVVVETGSERLGTWVEERRNILEDYQMLFGEPVPMISGVAIMTDTDNTGESALTYYGDIVFSTP